MLTTIGYDGPISIEWEDAGMGALEALAYIRSLLFDPPGLRLVEPALNCSRTQASEDDV